MSTLIDGSCLLTPQPTGVSNAVRELLLNRRFPLEGEATIGTIASGHLPHPLPDHGYAHVHRSLPSKAAHALALAGVPFHALIPGTWTRLLLPNLNIVGIPRLPFDILVHDLSFFVHPPWFTAKTRVWHRFARPSTLIQRAERVFAVSPQTERALIDLLAIPKERITQIPLRIEPLIRQASLRPLDTPYIFMFSGDDPRKNRACIERAFLELHKAHPDWILVIAGMSSASQHPNILHLPYLSTEERQRWLQHASLFVYPSWYEGFGLPLHEATSLGIPTIASSATTVTGSAPKNVLFLPPYAPTLWTQAFRNHAASA